MSDHECIYRNGLIIDMFAGGGGASEGIEIAMGRPIDIAVNHCPKAIAMHRMNHPRTKHYIEDVWEVSPEEATGDKPVLLMWFSPSCTHHSKARGGKPMSNQLRGQAWLAVKWAKAKRPKVMVLENVEEFISWGPLDKKGYPIKSKKGETFELWLATLKKLGYTIDHREIAACDHGAGTRRNRFFLVARCDGHNITWPEKTHGTDDVPYVSTGEHIDWDIQPKSILPYPIKQDGRKRMLASNTLRRIVRGGIRFALGEDSPYITRIGQTGWGGDNMSYPLEAPLGTIVGKNEHLLVAASINKWTVNLPGEQPQHGDIISTSHVLKMKNGNYGDSMHNPLPTITAGAMYLGEVRTFILKYYDTNVGHSINDPIHTITSKHRFAKIDYKLCNMQVEITEEQRYNAWWIARIFEDNGGEIIYPLYPSPRIQAVGNETGVIVDIGIRMLEPRELFNCQGFKKQYVIDKGLVKDCEVSKFEAKDIKRMSDSDIPGMKILKFTKADQVKLVGNSVSPYAAIGVIKSNIVDVYAKNYLMDNNIDIHNSAVF